jgi:elongation factor P
MALSFTDLKKGTIFQMDGTPYKVLEYKHTMMGRGSSSITVKIRSLIDGKVIDKTFKGSENIENAEVTSRPVQYLYSDGKQYYFMDTKNYEQFSISKDQMESKKNYILEGTTVTGQFFDGKLINIELPKNISLKVSYTENAVRGDTSTAVTKEAKLETGMVVKVPAFIKQGDIISVDTTTGTYRERVKS